MSPYEFRPSSTNNRVELAGNSFIALNVMLVEMTPSRVGGVLDRPKNE